MTKRADRTPRKGNSKIPFGKERLLVFFPLDVFGIIRSGPLDNKTMFWKDCDGISVQTVYIIKIWRLNLQKFSNFPILLK